jgi:hypothetical protein
MSRFTKTAWFRGTRGQGRNAIAVLGASYGLDFWSLAIAAVFLRS